MTLIRRTGLIVGLVLALGAWVGATSASASYVTAGSYPASFKGFSAGWEFSTPGGKVYACEGIGVDANLAGPTRSFVSWGSGDTFNSGCEDKSHLEVGTTLATNGCALTFRPGAETGSGTFSGTADLGPVGCGPMTLNGSVCKRKFYAQTGIPVTFTNKGSGSSSSVVAEISGPLTYYSEGPSGYCGGVAGSPHEMSFSASWELAAYNEGGERVSTALSANGLFITGSGGEQPVLEAESYPAMVDGEQSNSKKYTLELEGSRKVSCSQGDLEGTLTGSGSQVALVPNLQGCTAVLLGNEYNASVSLNGCQLKLNLAKEGPPYSASLGVECAGGGQIQISVSPLCVYEIAPQSGLSGVSLENTGSGSSRAVNLTLGVSNLAVSRVSGTTTKCGAKAQSGSLVGSGTLSGLH